ncbi:MAG: 50S ribosomal protein L25 [Deltaproteobacteria bacterium]|nr:50S ribosomal protein L25 [Deltaproteobacteria bacterium]
MEAAKIVAETRNKSGKSVCRKIREKGRIPAVFYGPDTTPIPLSLDPRDIEKIFSSPGGANTVIDLNIINSKDQSQLQKMAILKDWQIHPVRRTWLHADLLEINVDRPIVVNVPIQFMGKAKVVELGGIIEEVRREVSLECLPTMIPEFIEIDVSELGFGDSLHVRDLKVGEGVTIIDDGDLTLAAVMAPPEEEEKVAPAAAEIETAETLGEEPPEDTDK